VIFYANVENALPCGTATRSRIIFYSVVEDWSSDRKERFVQHLISQYGYLAVFVLMLAESACIPVPSEVIMMFGGALAAGAVAGAHPSLFGVFAAGVLGNVAGSYISWAVGKYAGQAAIRRWGRRVGIREHEIDKATAWFERHGPVAVLVGRVIPVIRTFISLPAGFAEMSAGTFGLYTTLGAIPWTAALAILGYALGANWEQVANDFHGPTYAIAGVLLIGLVVVIVRRRRAKTAQAAAPGAPPAAIGAPPAAAHWDGPAGPASPARAPRPGPYPAPDPWAPPPPGYQQPSPAYQQPNPAYQPNASQQPSPAYQPNPAGQYR
jgi:membrane protein DedA with SNARE-associated domain